MNVATFPYFDESDTKIRFIFLVHLLYLVVVKLVILCRQTQMPLRQQILFICHSLSVMMAGIIPHYLVLILTYFLAKRLINKGSKVTDKEVIVA